MAKEKESKVKNENKHFFKDVKAELKRVVWPTSKQMVSNVTAVITIVLVTAAITFCLDFVFESMNRYGINKIKENVQPKQEQTQVVDDGTSNNDNNGDANNSNDADNNNADNQGIDVVPTEENQNGEATNN